MAYIDEYGQQWIEQDGVLILPETNTSIEWRKDNQKISLDTLKQSKVAELNKLCNTEILSGFISSAKDNIEKHYDFDYEAQTNMLGIQGKIMKSILLQTQIEIKWYAKNETTCSIWTIEEFIKLCDDAELFKQSRIDKYKQLKLQVLSSETYEEVELINW
jgi:hypothetical protein